MQPQEQKKGLMESLGTEISEDIHPLLQKITDNIKTVAIVIGSIVLVAAVYTGYTLYTGYAMDRAKDELSTILSHEDGREKLNALASYLEKAPSGMKQGVRLELAKQAMFIGDHELAAGYWDQVAEHGEPGMQVVANLGRATSLSRAGKPQEALSILNALLEGAPESFKPVLLSEIGPLAEQTGDLEQAVNAYEEMKNMASEANRDYLEHKIDTIKDRIATERS